MYLYISFCVAHTLLCNVMLFVVANLCTALCHVCIYICTSFYVHFTLILSYILLRQICLIKRALSNSPLPVPKETVH